MKKVVGVVALVGLITAVPTTLCSAGAVEIPLPKITARVDVHPTPRLLKQGAQPVGLQLSGSFATRDRSHLPALRSFEFGYRAGLAVGGETSVPVCRRSVLESSPSRCAASLIGAGSGQIEEGSSRVSVQLAAYVSRSTRRSLTLLISGRGKTTDFVSSMSFSSSRSRLHAAWSIPRLEEGRASLASFELTLRRSVQYRGVREPVLSGRCPGAGLQADVHAELRDELESGIGDQQVDAAITASCSGAK